MISIRHATRKDAELVADLSRQTFYETFAPANTQADMDKFMLQQFTKGRLMLEVGARDNYFMIAEENGLAAGYIKLRDGRPPAALQLENSIEIARLYVIASMIGSGVGKILMQAGIDMAIEMDKEAVWLGVWEKNQRAIDFYTRWGFEKFGETNFVLGDDVQRDWLMRKLL